MVLPLAAASIARFSSRDERAAKRVVSGLSLNMTSNASAVQKAMQGFSKQMPFAMSQALNATAFDVRKEIVDKTYPQSFNVRNKRFAGTMFRVEKATKKKLRASVFDRLKKDYMVDQAEGGIKTPRGKSIAIPGRDMKMRTKGGVTKANRPRNLLNKKGVFKTTSTRSGQPIIVRRATKKRYPLQMMYILEPSGVIKKRFDFYEDANATARREIDRAFAKRFKRAKATARR